MERGANNSAFHLVNLVCLIDSTQNTRYTHLLVKVALLLYARAMILWLVCCLSYLARQMLCHKWHLNCYSNTAKGGQNFSTFLLCSMRNVLLSRQRSAVQPQTSRPGKPTKACLKVEAR